jgi:hypothetical protein
MTTHSDPSFDQRIADWLERDPDTAPDAVLDTVLAAVPSIPQRRRGLGQAPGAGGWRTTPMTSTLKLALGAAAAIAVVVAGLYVLQPGTSPGVGGSSPTVTPSPGPSPTPAWQSYSSDRFAYSIDFPGGWEVTPATADWPDGGWPNPTSRAVDRLAPASDDALWVMVSSRALGPDEEAADVRAVLDEENSTICDISNPRTVSVDGNEARAEDQLCFGANYVIETLASDGRRVYLIDWISPRAITAEERATFDAMLASVTLGE